MYSVSVGIKVLTDLPLLIFDAREGWFLAVVGTPVNASLSHVSNGSSNISPTSSQLPTRDPQRMALTSMTILSFYGVMIVHFPL